MRRAQILAILVFLAAVASYAGVKHGLPVGYGFSSGR
jgi:hypothetical protein